MSALITIRTAEVNDAERLLKIYAPYVEKTAISFEYRVPTKEEFEQRIRNTLQKYPYFVAECEGELVGYTYARPFHEREAYQWGAESSIYVKMEKRGCGIGGMLYARLEEALKQMGILNLNACIAYAPTEDEYLTNDSERFHSHMGYQKVAENHMCGYKFGRWYHIIWMEKMLGEHTANPTPVKSFREIQ